MGRPGHRAYVVALIAAYVAGLVVLVTSPWGWELNRLTVRLWAFFRFDVPVVSGGIGPEYYGVLLNLLLFVPFGVLGWLVARRTRGVVVAALMCSSVIERSQGRWLERDGSWVDVVANTCGALLGAVLVRWWSRDPRRRAPRP